MIFYNIKYSNQCLETTYVNYIVHVNSCAVIVLLHLEGFKAHRI